MQVVPHRAEDRANSGRRVETEFYPLANSKRLRNDLLLYDAVIVYRAPATPDVLDVLWSAERYAVTTFYDIDDLIFDETCYPPSRKSLEPFVSPVEYAGLVTGRDLFREAIVACDYAIA